MTRLSKLCVSFVAPAALLSLVPPAHADDAFTLKVGGRVMIDYNIVDADSADLSVNASEARRVRLDVSGKYGANLKYKVELNTDSSGEVNVEDAYLDFKLGTSGWAVRAGQFRTPNALDEQTSSRFISVLERAAFTDAFQLNRRLGVMATYKGDAYTIAAGAFGENLEADTNEEGFALAARGTYTPIDREGALVHLGGSVRYREAGDTAGDLRYRQRPFAHIPGRVASTGRIAGSDMFYGAEAAALLGQFWTSGEYAVTVADTVAGADPNLQGYYLEAGYFLGGRKTYSGGKFGRPVVDTPITDGGYGAVSFVARYDAIDLSDAAVNGGELDTFIIGADWWPTKRVRIGANYFNGDVNYGSSTSGLDSAFAAAVVAGTPSDTVSGLVARLQFDF